MRSVVAHWWWLAAVVAAVSPQALAAQVGPDAFDFGAFGALADADKLNFVLAVLDARDRSLENVAYKVRETYVNIRKDNGARRFVTRHVYEFRRIGDKCWMHRIDYKFRDPTGAVRAESIMNWDGKVAKGIGIPPYLGTPYHQCRIDPEESENFAYHRLGELLGFRIDADFKRRPVTVWFRDSIDRGAKIEITEADVRGVRTLSVQMGWGEWQRRLWLDPNRSFMTVRAEHVYGGAKEFMKGTLEVVTSEQVDGLWVPKKVIRQTGTYASQEWGETTIDVEQFSVGKVTDSDVDVVFPVGSHIVDTVQNISYVVLLDGKYKLLPLANPEAHILHEPPQANITHRVDSSAAKLYTTRPLSLEPPVGTPPQQWSYRRVIPALASVLVAAAAICIWMRRRTAAKP
ncbi:MAG: hypothetical protein NTU53_10650 [Planctomycetota bacterium]|nr:hypothetical protein [Planctomycetota bacterium]